MNFKLDLTEEQYNALQNATEASKNLAEIIYREFKRVGLDKMQGCRFEMTVSPEYTTLTREVEFGYYGRDDNEVGYFDFRKGEDKDEWHLSSDSSGEYAILFAGEDIRRRIRKIVSDEESVSSCTLWISDHDDPPVVDGGQ